MWIGKMCVRVGVGGGGSESEGSVGPDEVFNFNSVQSIAVQFIWQGCYLQSLLYLVPTWVQQKLYNCCVVFECSGISTAVPNR
jgi:hypothetical protein